MEKLSYKTPFKLKFKSKTKITKKQKDKIQKFFNYIYKLHKNEIEQEVRQKVLDYFLYGETKVKVKMSKPSHNHPWRKFSPIQKTSYTKDEIDFNNFKYEKNIKKPAGFIWAKKKSHIDSGNGR